KTPTYHKCSTPSPRVTSDTTPVPSAAENTSRSTFVSSDCGSNLSRRRSPHLTVIQAIHEAMSSAPTTFNVYGCHRLKYAYCFKKKFRRSERAGLFLKKKKNTTISHASTAILSAPLQVGSLPRAFTP